MFIFGIVMDNNELTLYDKIINNIPSYVKNSLSVIGVVIFTACSLYLLHVSAISYRTAYLSELGVPYFTHTINLWEFYVLNFHLLLIFIVSFVLFIGIYILAWLGMLGTNKSIYEYVLYSFFLALIIFSFTLVAKRYELQIYAIFVILFAVIISVLRYKNDAVTSDNIGNIKKIENKLIIYFLALLATLIALFYPFAGVFVVNSYIADKYGRSEGKALLKSIKNDEYIKTRNAALIKSSGEYVYSLDCSESSCFTIRTTEGNELLFETIERKDLIFKLK